MFQLTNKPIDVQQVINQVTDRNCGAIATFIGTVREFTNGKKTVRLEYIAYESMAEKMLKRIGAEINERWPGTNVAIVHRLGVLDISEAAVVIAVSSPHRQAAYEANAYAMERIKAMVPIWKKEIWEDGSSWIGDQLETKRYT
ncbi:molybdenum cofactor biosynthesis protein MoaE [Shouchella clausii]|uniref:Molybdopterin synthase catalytic subunit n=3 Tax=Shouchella TaxID=2893057 RepID=Q5WJL9_SHOC1|nr:MULTISPECIES: molybdenum cofactor biosynthesis protein MoaE [Shouchella]MCM3311876.1 molybdenum cofactor biosynthesis protein MoaE [Psychrobacillus sp. MER TA 17]ALA51931.1 Molybdenum cofactor biosynthesis protein MoaE [Shouchella clausii]AST94784.1 molybdopterin (MPT) converting factor, subunit 2 [Shouchella clausii]KKI84870.1 molybdopterin (MPT) converting factor, subunit 2 [Shouchella clausii]MCM3381266.1 molybdenum cofactor biosynthesis protein MoaE [Shouchella rhizosphaerae]